MLNFKISTKSHAIVNALDKKVIIEATMMRMSQHQNTVNRVDWFVK